MSKRQIRKRVKKGRQVSEAVEDPFKDIDYSTGNVEDHALEEASALLKGFKERANNETDRFELAVDSEFWFSLGFKSRDQKEKFLHAMDWLQHGDKYLNGVVIAEQEGIELPEAVLVSKEKLRSKVDKKLFPLTRNLLEK